jgi:hypothetical protein
LEFGVQNLYLKMTIPLKSGLINLGDLVKSLKRLFSVIPAHAGIQSF